MKKYCICISGCIFALLLGGLIAFSQQSPSVIWMEAEAFDDTGGWSNDPQFVDLMGSPYLLATGVNEPVEDAVTQVNIPAEGGYRLWVRCKDWLPDYSPGKFQVLVNGQASAVTLGKSSQVQWQWVDGGQFTLNKGKTEIRLHDLTGWWGRCDAVVLTADKDFQPSNELLLLEAQRNKYFKPYRNMEKMDDYDVVVVGGGLAGSAAAVAAARHGSSVALIQDRPVLGGNASSEIDVPPGGDQSRQPLDPGETGIIEEFYLKQNRGWEYDWSPAIEKVVKGEPNIDLFFETRAINVIMKDIDTIEAVIAMDIHSGRRMIFPAKIFIDCTGDGWIGYYSGAEFSHGREGRSEFGETLAPKEADSFTMGNTLFVAKFKEGVSEPFESPEWAYEWTSREDFNRSGTHFSLDQKEYPAEEADWSLNRFTHGAGFYGRQYVYDLPELESSVQFDTQTRNMPVTPDHYKTFERGKGYAPRNENGGFFQWYIELGGTMNTIKNAELIRDELFRINLGLWDFVKNHDPEYKEKNKNRQLTWINYIPGKRESRRLAGDYILTQWDYEDKIIHEDNVAYGGWGVDVHHPNGFWKKGPMYYSAYRGQKISIPFRCLFSRNISNLMMAGRDVSVSHVALGGVRVMRTTCLMGQAVGVAADLCADMNIVPRTAGKKYIDEIQQRLLKDGAYIMGQKNEDPEDLALKAEITASSAKKILDPRSKFANTNTPLIHDLNMKRAVMFKPNQERIDQISLYLRSENDKPTPITLTLRQSRKFKDFSSTKDLASASAKVPPNSEGWISFGLNYSVDPDKYYFVVLPPKQGLKWDLFPHFLEDTCRAYGGPSWTPRDECYAFTLNKQEREPVVQKQVTLAPENLNNGWNRAVNGVPNSWGPSTDETLPQWVDLQFPRLMEFNTVHVTYQNLHYVCHDYDIVVEDNGSWKKVVSVQDNKLRRIVHHFDQVVSNRLRLILNAPAAGDSQDYPQVCEIRVYDE